MYQEGWLGRLTETNSLAGPKRQIGYQEWWGSYWRAYRRRSLT